MSPRALPVLLLAGACAAGGGEPAPPELVPLEELPAEDRRALAAYYAGGEEWARLREEIKADPARARWMCENLALELFRAYDDADLAAIGEERGPFERARAELLYFDEQAVGVLVELLPASDGVVPVVASELLARIGAPAVAPVAELLDHEAWRTRRYAVELLAELPRADGGDVTEAELRARLAALADGDPEWIVRAQAARTLGARGAAHGDVAPAREALLGVLSDEDPAVRREAAAALTALDDPRAVPALLNYLQRSERDHDARGVRAAREALTALTGAKVQGDVRAWRNWWSDHRGELLQPTPDPPY